jgi:hypothetical protein
VARSAADVATNKTPLSPFLTANFVEISLELHTSGLCASPALFILASEQPWNLNLHNSIDPGPVIRFRQFFPVLKSESWRNESGPGISLPKSN